MRFTEFLQEDATAGSVGTAVIAASFTPMIGGKPIKRVGTKKLKFKTIKLGEDVTPTFNSFDVKSKMTNAERANNLKKDSAVYGIEDDEGNITKVYVDKNQEHDFKHTLSSMLKSDDKLDVAEILFDLRNTFNILFVEWPKMPEDEETVNVLDKKEGEEGKPGEEGALPKEGEEPIEPTPPAPEPTPPATPDSESILLKVIDMLRADADAKKAEATAKAKESEAETAKFSVQLSNIKVKNEEDMLKADDYFKKQSEAKKDQERIAKLAKYRNEVVKNTTYEADMSFLQTMIDSQTVELAEETVSEDLNSEVQQLQTQIADINARKMRAMKVYDDQLRLLQQKLSAKTKQNNQQQQQADRAAQTQQAQPVQGQPAAQAR